MSRIWRTISRSGRKRVQVRTGNHGGGRPPIHIHKDSDGPGVGELMLGGLVALGTLWMLWELWPVIAVCALVGAVLAMCVG